MYLSEHTWVTLLWDGRSECTHFLMFNISNRGKVTGFELDVQMSILGGVVEVRPI